MGFVTKRWNSSHSYYKELMKRKRPSQKGTISVNLGIQGFGKASLQPSHLVVADPRELPMERRLETPGLLRGYPAFG